MLSQTVTSLIDYGFNTNFCTCKRITFLEDDRGVLGHGELVYVKCVSAIGKITKTS